jgi:hypothetical protein
MVQGALRTDYYFNLTLLRLCPITMIDQSITLDYSDHLVTVYRHRFLYRIFMVFIKFSATILIFLNIIKTMFDQ